MSEHEDLTKAICIMLRQRAYRGNCQTKHGIEAGYDWECFNFVEALDEWLTRRDRMKEINRHLRK